MTARLARIALHIWCALHNHEWAFHAAGIRREFHPHQQQQRSMQ